MFTFTELCHISMCMWKLEIVMIANESDGDGDETVKRILMKGMRQFPYQAPSAPPVSQLGKIELGRQPHTLHKPFLIMIRRKLMLKIRMNVEEMDYDDEKKKYENAVIIWPEQIWKLRKVLM